MTAVKTNENSWAKKKLAEREAAKNAKPNHAPKVQDLDLGTIGDDMSVPFDLTQKVTDEDGDAITITFTEELTKNGGTIKKIGEGRGEYTPPKVKSNTADEFAYEVADGKGGTASGK